MPSINDNLSAGFADLNPTVDAIAADLATVAAAPTIARLDTIIALLEAQEVEIPATSSFPAEPSVGDKVFYTPQNAIFIYDGDYWWGPRIYVPAPPFTSMPYTGVAPVTLGYIPTSQWGAAFYCEVVVITALVATTNNGSNYWTLGLANVAGSAIATLSTAAYAANTNNTAPVAVDVNLPVDSATFRVFSKVGAPGGLYAAMTLFGRSRIPA